MTLEVDGGCGALVAGGSARVRVTARGFAAWYAGGITAAQAARLGLIQGDDNDLALMDSLRGCRECRLPDQY